VFAIRIDILNNFNLIQTSERHERNLKIRAFFVCLGDTVIRFQIKQQMSILIEKGGVLSTIQDLGRTGFRRFGINPNGAMDKTAVRLINILIGNDENAAVMEIHFPAPAL